VLAQAEVRENARFESLHTADESSGRGRSHLSEPSVSQAQSVEVADVRLLSAPDAPASKRSLRTHQRNP